MVSRKDSPHFKWTAGSASVGGRARVVCESLPDPLAGWYRVVGLDSPAASTACPRRQKSCTRPDVSTKHGSLHPGSAHLCTAGGTGSAAIAGGVVSVVLTARPPLALGRAGARWGAGCNAAPCSGTSPTLHVATAAPVPWPVIPLGGTVATNPWAVATAPLTGVAGVSTPTAPARPTPPTEHSGA